MPNEDSVMYLQTELISCRLQEAEALTELKALKQHIKDLEEKWQVTLDGGKEKKIFSVQYTISKGYQNLTVSLPEAAGALRRSAKGQQRTE